MDNEPRYALKVSNDRRYGSWYGVLDLTYPGRGKVIDWCRSCDEAQAKVDRLNSLPVPRRLPPCDEVPF